MLTKANRDLPAMFDPGRDCWIVQVPMGLTASHEKGIRAFLEQFCKDRLLMVSKAIHPTKYETAMKALKAARSGRIEQYVVTKGYVTLFESTEKTKT